MFEVYTMMGSENIVLPKKTAELVGGKDFKIESIGMSDSTVITFDDSVLKIENHNKGIDNTIDMMAWLKGKVPVPEIIHHEVTGGKSYLLMSRIKGKMCCDPYCMERSEEMVHMLADGLKMLWSVDISDCKRQFSLDTDLRDARANVEKHRINTKRVEFEAYEKDRFETPEQLLWWLEDNRPEYEPVLSHGDYCLPNVFLDGGRISGFIDLGYTGIADKYRDIATCYRSLRNNFNGSFGGKIYSDFDPNILLKELKIEPNSEKLKYYMLLDVLLA